MTWREAEDRRRALRTPVEKALEHAAALRRTQPLEVAVRDLAPLLACYTYGHEFQPRHFLGRFRDRPWRCPRCHTWWVTRATGDYSWEWVSVTYPSPPEQEDAA